MINGIINVYKEKGFTSFDVCAVMRGISGQRKVGHTGTLDPNAEGVLPVCLGSATKLCDMLTDKTKEYVATFVLGKRTDTLDIWGEVLETREPVVSVERLIETILSFKGGYLQMPPMYSAKKVNGQRMYDLARKGREMEREAVFVEISDIEVLSMDFPYATIRVECGKGTYIRSLCEDIGKKCGELATMTELKRTRVSNFRIEEAYTIDELTKLKNEGALPSVVRGTDECFNECEKLRVKKEFRKLIDNGNKLHFNMVEGNIPANDGALVRIYNDEWIFVGLFIVNTIEKAMKPYKMFIGE